MRIWFTRKRKPVTVVEPETSEGLPKFLSADELQLKYDDTLYRWVHYLDWRISRAVKRNEFFYEVAETGLMPDGLKPRVIAHYEKQGFTVNDQDQFGLKISW